MTQPRPRSRRSTRRTSTTSGAGRDRLSFRYRRPGESRAAMDAETAWLRVDAAVRRATYGQPARTGEPVPDVQDCLDALAQRVEVQQLDDIREVQIIEWARTHGASWRDIGAALGYSTRSAKQGAYDRYTALARRYPAALTANRTPDGCGSTPNCCCKPNAMIRQHAGCDSCQHCTPSPEEKPARA